MKHIFKTFNKYSEITYFNCNSLEEAFSRYKKQFSKTEEEAIEAYDFDRST